MAEETSESDSSFLAVVCVLLIIGAIIGGVVGMFIGVNMWGETLPNDQNLVAFQKGEMRISHQSIDLREPLSIEELHAEVLLPGTRHTYLQYSLTPDEARLLGPGFGERLANNVIVEETEATNGLSFNSSGWIIPLPSRVNPEHIAISQRW
ncbi:MAG: hypothetical protein WC520_03725 [Candidatus Paceibacterota bacterium]